MWCLFQNIFQWNYGNRSFIKVNGIVNEGDEEDSTRTRRNHSLREKGSLEFLRNS